VAIQLVVRVLQVLADSSGTDPPEMPDLNRRETLGDKTEDVRLSGSEPLIFSDLVLNNNRLRGHHVQPVGAVQCHQDRLDSSCGYQFDIAEIHGGAINCPAVAAAVASERLHDHAELMAGTHWYEQLSVHQMVGPVAAREQVADPPRGKVHRVGQIAQHLRMLRKRPRENRQVLLSPLRGGSRALMISRNVDPVLIASWRPCSLSGNRSAGSRPFRPQNQWGELVRVSAAVPMLEMTSDQGQQLKC
jgi:hypothetical protein